MKIRNKILTYFSVIVNLLTGVTFVIIFLLFADYREEQFLNQQKERINTTLQLFSEIKKEDEEVQETMDILTVYDYYDEKLMIFNADRQLVYVSKEDIPTPDVSGILESLSRENTLVKTREAEFEIVGIYTETREGEYYAISKAYDDHGFTKMKFLRNVLIGIFIFIAIIVVLISQFLSSKIADPITKLTRDLNKMDPGSSEKELLTTDTDTHEIVQLTQRFNDLLDRTEKAFAFQKHTIDHISHQLKTPIAVLVSELERLRQSEDKEEIKEGLQNQIIKAKSLGGIVNVLLEISKIESGQQFSTEKSRVDEMVFDVINELNIIAPDFTFDLQYQPEHFDEKNLIIDANPLLMRQAFHNLLHNCLSYSDNSRAEVTFDCSDTEILRVRIVNTGETISPEESKLLFNHFFRGENSQSISGFGLGLVLTRKILELHEAEISYKNPGKNINIFELHFRLR